MQVDGGPATEPARGSGLHDHGRRGTDVLVLLALLAGSLALNVGLARRLRSPTLGGATPPAPKPLETGARVSDLEVFDLAGRGHVLTLYGQTLPTVIYVFTPQCAWCQLNLDNVRTLESLGGSRFRFVGISLSKEGLRRYLAGHPLPFPVYDGLSLQTVRSLGLGGTPQTIVVSPAGRVVRTWVGAYGGETGLEVQKFFQVRLPGLREDESRP